MRVIVGRLLRPQSLHNKSVSRVDAVSLSLSPSLVMTSCLPYSLHLSDLIVCPISPPHSSRCAMSCLFVSSHDGVPHHVHLARAHTPIHTCMATSPRDALLYELRPAALRVCAGISQLSTPPSSLFPSLPSQARPKHTHTDTHRLRDHVATPSLRRRQLAEHREDEVQFSGSAVTISSGSLRFAARAASRMKLLQPFTPSPYALYLSFSL